MSLTTESDWKLGCVDEAAEQSLVAGNGLFGAVGGIDQLVEIMGAAVGQRVHLQPTPCVFDRIQFGSVGRKVFDLQPRVFGGITPNACRAMHRQTIPNKHDWAFQVTQQLPQPAECLRLLDRLAVKLPGKTEATPSRADRKSGNCREVFVRAEPLMNDRREAGSRPGATHQGTQQNAAFVREDEVRPEPRRLFLMCGQSLRIQVSMAASSRSSARRVGFCGVKPRLRSSRDT